MFDIKDLENHIEISHVQGKLTASLEIWKEIAEVKDFWYGTEKTIIEKKIAEIEKEYSRLKN